MRDRRVGATAGTRLSRKGRRGGNCRLTRSFLKAPVLPRVPEAGTPVTAGWKPTHRKLEPQPTSCDAQRIHYLCPVRFRLAHPIRSRRNGWRFRRKTTHANPSISPLRPNTHFPSLELGALQGILSDERTFSEAETATKQPFYRRCDSTCRIASISVTGQPAIGSIF